MTESGELGKPKETYSTEKAWQGLETDVEKRYWRRMARYFKRENEKLKEEIKQLKKKDDSYIETILKK